MGIINYIYQRFRDTNDRIVIVDVGCSNGLALTWCKKCLLNKDITVSAIGIEPSEKEDPESDLDEFIPKEVKDVHHHVGEADVVICVNVINWLHCNPNTIFLDALKFLKNGGIMITDASVPPAYLEGLNQQTDFKRTRLCLSKYDLCYLYYWGHSLDVYEKPK